MTSLGTWRFLKDHYVNGEYIQAGDIREMFTPWSPTADVEPLDQVSLTAFYDAGPSMGGVWRTVFSNKVIYKPVTYWTQVAANLWALTGLGGGASGTGGGFSIGFSNGFDIGTGGTPPLSPILANISRVEDKEV